MVPMAAAAAWEIGDRVEVQWRAGGSWQARVIVGFATATEFETVMGTAPPAGAEERREIPYMITPDGDMYPHVLHTDVVRGAVKVHQGRRDRASVVGTAPAANARTYGADWTPEPRVFLEAVAAASARSFAEVAATLRRQPAPRAAALDSRSAPFPPEWEIVSSLPDPDSKGWYILAGSDQSSSAKLPSLTVD